MYSAVFIKLGDVKLSVAEGKVSGLLNRVTSVKPANLLFFSFITTLNALSYLCNDFRQRSTLLFYFPWVYLVYFCKSI